MPDLSHHWVKGALNKEVDVALWASKNLGLAQTFGQGNMKIS